MNILNGDWLRAIMMTLILKMKKSKKKVNIISQGVNEIFK